MNKQSESSRPSDREFVVSRSVHASASSVFEAWSNSSIFEKWWVPKEAPMTLTSCEMDVRTGGSYRLVFKFGDQTMAFFGKYLEVTSPSRLVWTNEESGTSDATITTVTLTNANGSTLVTVHDLYPTKEALDEAIANGSTEGMPAQLAQLDELLRAR